MHGRPVGMETQPPRPSRSSSSMSRQQAIGVAVPPSLTLPAPPVVPIRAVLAVSPRGFIVIWWLLQLCHVVLIVYSIQVIRLHRYFIVQNLHVTIDYMGPTPFGFFNVVIAAHAVLALCHVAGFLQSVWWSLHYRQWRFMDMAKAQKQLYRQRRNTLIKQTILSSRTATGSSIPKVAVPSRALSYGRQTLQKFTHAVRRAGLALFGRYGIFGVEGTHYESSFFALEIVEIALQIFQAYKLSKLVPRVWINRLNMAVLILNCWSTAFVHRFLKRDRLVTRVVLLVVDGVFDIISGMVIPLVIVVPYYLQFDIERRDFPLVNYYHDVWLIQAISENRQIFVSSWLDFISKFTPGVTVFGGMLVLKNYLVMDRSSIGISASQFLAIHAQPGSFTRARSLFMVALQSILPTTQTRVEPLRRISVGSAAAGGGTKTRWRSTVSVADDVTGSSTAADGSAMQLTRGERLTVTTALFTKYTHTWQHVVLICSGVALLAIHVHSTTVAELSDTHGCLLEVRPWFATRYTCIALEFNCANGDHHDGADVASFQEKAETLTPSTLKSLIFASCSRLYMPPIIQRFSALQMIKIYNSTIVQWDTAAELRKNLHPDLQLLYVSDSNFSSDGGDGFLPIGLLSDAFPTSLVDIEFSGTNLVGLPADLDQKWTFVQYFVLERNPRITDIPSVLVTMKIPQLMLCSNSITRIPEGLLADQAFWVLMLNGNPLVALPDKIGDLHKLYRLGVAFTNATTLPEWITTVQLDAVTGKPVVSFLGYMELLAGGSPLCEDTNHRDTAIATMPEWLLLDCSTQTSPHVYPIEYERRWRAATQATIKSS